MKRFLAPLVLFAVFGACSPLFSGDETMDPVRVGFVSRQGDQVSGTGAVEWFTIEGGFFAIRGDDGRVYDPMNLPAAFAKDGARVRFEGRIRGDMGSFHMVGEIVELKSIAVE
jgi:hypothetical protein